MSFKDLYSEVKKRKMEALNKKDIVKAVEKYGKILAVEGRFEKPKNVVENMYAAEKRTIKPSQIMKYELELFDIVLIGCPGDQIPEAAHPRIQVFVQNGGWLITTDWALVSIVEKLFPGYLRWNGQKTADAVVACQLADPTHPFLDGVKSEMTREKWIKKATKNAAIDEFRWWLETKSYPIRVINPVEVNVLIYSRDIKYKWGEGAVLCYFDVGTMGGRVIHIISHTHLQKGGEKGKFVSALILTNILDERISRKMGIPLTSSVRYVSDWTQTQTPKYTETQFQTQGTFNPSPGGDDWLRPPTSSENYIIPSSTANGRDGADSGEISLMGTSQINEADRNSFSLTTNCAYCTLDFNEYAGKIYICQECKAAYHEGCLNNQINEGTCKSCNRILLW